MTTLHRPINVDNKEKLIAILEGINNSGIRTIFPVHPRTKKTLEKINTERYFNINFIDAVGYLEFLLLLNNSRIVLTDSGGLQKEAFFAKVPCLSFKYETEWIETIDIGSNQFIGWTPSKETVENKNVKIIAYRYFLVSIFLRIIFQLKPCLNFFVSINLRATTA